MAELMGDPRDPDAQDGAFTAVDYDSDLELENYLVESSVAVGGDMLLFFAPSSSFSGKEYWGVFLPARAP